MTDHHLTREEVEQIVKEVVDLVGITIPILTVFPDDENNDGPSIQCYPGDDSRGRHCELWWRPMTYPLANKICGEELEGICAPTLYNLDLFALLHELGHAKDAEDRGAEALNAECLAERIPRVSRLPWLLYNVLYPWVLRRHFNYPLERRASEFALRWMKEFAKE